MVAEELTAAGCIPEVVLASMWRMHKIRGDREARQEMMEVWMVILILVYFHN